MSQTTSPHLLLSGHATETVRQHVLGYVAEHPNARLTWLTTRFNERAFEQKDWPQTLRTYGCKLYHPLVKLSAGELASALCPRLMSPPSFQPIFYTKLFQNTKGGKAVPGKLEAFRQRFGSELYRLDDVVQAVRDLMQPLFEGRQQCTPQEYAQALRSRCPWWPENWQEHLEFQSCLTTLFRVPEARAREIQQADGGALINDFRWLINAFHPIMPPGSVFDYTAALCVLRRLRLEQDGAAVVPDLDTAPAQLDLLRTALAYAQRNQFATFAARFLCRVDCCFHDSEQDDGVLTALLHAAFGPSVSCVAFVPSSVASKLPQTLQQEPGYATVVADPQALNARAVSNFFRSLARS